MHASTSVKRFVSVKDFSALAERRREVHTSALVFDEEECFDTIQHMSSIIDCEELRIAAPGTPAQRVSERERARRVRRRAYVA